MNTIRAFIAIHLPSSVRDELTDVSDNLSAQIPRNAVRWVKPELMHLTVRFLGNTAVSSLPSIYAALDKTAARHGAFTLRLDHLGCFPNCKRPRVIWAGIQGQLDAADKLKKDIDTALLALGWEEEDRPFRPHLTLGRVKDNRKFRDLQWETHVNQLPLPVQAVHLVESELTRDGPIYTNRHTCFLQQ